MEIISLAPPWRPPRSVASSPRPSPRSTADACRWPTAFSLRRWENGRSRPGCLLGTTPWFERRSRRLGGGGWVGGAAAGRGETVAVRVDPEVIQGEDLEMLQDLIGAATNEALRRS